MGLKLVISVGWLLCRIVEWGIFVALMIFQLYYEGSKD